MAGLNHVSRLIATGGALALASCGAPGSSPAGTSTAFARCAACHSIAPGGKRGIGPNLYGVIGRKAGQAAGFSYSPALRDSGIVWSAATLDRYIADPAAMVPGTRMNIRVDNAADRAAIIKDLQSP